ncbi:MAG: hypothetical protein AABY32_03805 [Nanoarchaeota archaeon]
MVKSLEAKTHDGKTHCWEGLTEYKIDNDEDLINQVELYAEGSFNIANKLKANQYFIAKTVSLVKFGGNYFDNYINNLKSLGLDIGKGNCEYGYKMPLPEKGEDRRKLIIFRRKTKEEQIKNGRQRNKLRQD